MFLPSLINSIQQIFNKYAFLPRARKALIIILGEEGGKGTENINKDDTGSFL